MFTEKEREGATVKMLNENKLKDLYRKSYSSKKTNHRIKQNKRIDLRKNENFINLKDPNLCHLKRDTSHFNTDNNFQSSTL